jgi:hypothetical protein
MSEYGASVEGYRQEKTEWLGEQPVPVPVYPQVTQGLFLAANPGICAEKPVYLKQ